MKLFSSALAFFLALMALLFVVLGLVKGAPLLPSTKKEKVATVLTEALLTGKWTVHWGYTPCTMYFGKNGSYECLWCGTKYVGTWSIARGSEQKTGQLWITESCDILARAESWTSYGINIDPKTLAGPIIFGTTGVQVKMTRFKEEKNGEK